LSFPDLQNNFLFDTTYVSSTWSHQDQTHTLTLQHTVTKEQRHQTVDILISANGPLCRPTIPNIPGLEAFKGVHFHNLRWDSSVEFENKRVAVIGIGSSAIQFIVSLVDVMCGVCASLGS
jgi:cation diffusion facilitator CzcD-associated flavoprotein CzcO